MMHQQHAEGLLGGQLRQMAIERIELRAAEPCRSPSAAASAPPRRRRSAPAARAGARRETARRRLGVVAAQIILERLGEAMPRGAHIGVVIAGNRW